MSSNKSQKSLVTRNKPGARYQDDVSNSESSFSQSQSRWKNPNELRSIICEARDAVVHVTGRFEKTIEEGNGFFMRGHYIICPASLIIFEGKIANKILVDVSNVNGLGKAFSYNAELVGYDGAGNIAVLIIPGDYINISHPTLKWGKSRNVCPGDKVVLIGDILHRLSNDRVLMSENGVLIGNIGDNRYVCPLGEIPGELLLLTTCSNQGLPVLSCEGHVIGMVLDDYVALSEFFMRRPIKAIVRSYIDSTKNQPDPKYVGFIDDSNKIYRYIKSSLGIGGFLVTQNDFVNNNDSPREIIGYQVNYIVDHSELVHTLEIGDHVTHINGKPLGDRKGQTSPALIMWSICPGNIVTITYLKQSEKFTNPYEFSTPTHVMKELWDRPTKTLLI